MQSKYFKHQNKETTQETFRKLREKDRIEMHEKMQKIEDAQDRARAAIARRERKRDKGRKKENPLPNVPDTKKGRKVANSSSVFPNPEFEACPRRPIPMTTKLVNVIKSKQQQRKRRGKCANCCGGLPGQGPRPVAAGCAGRCCCSSEIRLRGGSDTDRWKDENPSRSFRVRSSSENPRVLRTPQNHCCGNSSRMSIFEDRGEETRFNCGQDPQRCDIPREGERVRGGCGSCGVQRSATSNRPATSPNPTCLKQVEFPCDRPSPPSGKPTNSQQSGGCPCGGCGGPACSDNPGGGGREGGCCGGNRPQGKPCKCKCQSCDQFRPLGGCGGQSCGKMYSCAGSGGGRCCFPRNTKRRSGPDCCGGGDPNCGGCC